MAENSSGTIYWPELVPATLLTRYKRFLADVELESGKNETVHCPNSGSMTGCSSPGRRVYLSYHDNPRRRLRYTWEIIDMPGSLVGVNTLVPNRLAAGAVRAGLVAPLSGYKDIKPEVRAGENSRLDLLLSNSDGSRCFVEIKNCTLVERGRALFPDAVTARGRQHLVEMERLVSQGARCVMFFLIQRMDAEVFSPADHIDPRYCMQLRRAAEEGVEVLAYDVHIDLEKIRLRRAMPVIL